MTHLALAHRPSDARLDDAIDDVLAARRPIDLVFQPIVDLARGIVAGYETLARFPGPPGMTPDVWLSTARRRGVDINIELRILMQAIEARLQAPRSCFLTVNLGPQVLLAPEWIELVDCVSSLDGLVIEVTEHAAIDDYDKVRKALDRARAKGMLVAVDDAGSGYASLSHIMALRPDFVKVDRAFAVECDRDPAKVAVIELMNAFAGRIDASVIVEGIERREELESIASLDVPLGQGFLFGRPSSTWQAVPDDIATHPDHRRAWTHRDWNKRGTNSAR
jgi:EAL domain-containing protein (putative c-di-GMP-specific phosphodiesterase class I)